MLILVTGAAGRIGSHLTRALVREGHRVRAFVLPGDSRTAGTRVHRWSFAMAGWKVPMR